MDGESGQIDVLNHEEARQYLGGVIFVSILMIIGIIGNAHVLYVYAFRMKPSNHRVFILFLAVLDLVTCLIGMPFVIIDLRNPLTFTMTTLCKILRFVNYFTCTSSVFILTVIAIDRYRKICVFLGKQISQTMAKAMCVLCLCFSVVLNWPAPVLYGHSSVNTTIPSITGSRCFIEDKFLNTHYFALYNFALILFVSIIFCILVVLYTFIARTIKHRAVKMTSRQDHSSSDAKPTESTDDAVKEPLQDKNINKKTEIEAVAESSETSNNSGTKENFIKLNADNKNHSQFKLARRTTFMLFLVTAFFFISYFPHLCLQIITFTIDDFVENMSFTGKVLYNTFLYCFFINNMVNCFIYGFCDRRFRQEIKKMYGNIFRGLN